MNTVVVQSTKIRQNENGLYCAERCGRGCTHDEYEKARQTGLAVAKLLGPRWQVWVHDNLGWHWSAILFAQEDELEPFDYDYLRVFPHRGSNPYFIDSRIGGEQFAIYDSDPIRGVTRLLESTRAELIDKVNGVDRLNRLFFA